MPQDLSWERRKKKRESQHQGRALASLLKICGLSLLSTNMLCFLLSVLAGDEAFYLRNKKRRKAEIDWEGG